MPSPDRRLASPPTRRVPALAVALCLAFGLQALAQPSPMRMTIDLPRAGASLSMPFYIGGWAIDTAAAAGTGVDAVHVWAFPADGGSPTFAGATTTFVNRPDVAASYGSQFLQSGF